MVWARLAQPTLYYPTLCFALVLRRVGEQGARFGSIVCAGSVGEQTIMANAVKAVGQDVQQEAADELVRIERHNAVAGLALAPVILPFEADAGMFRGVGW